MIDELQALVEQGPELRKMLSDLFTYDDGQELNKLQLALAEKAKGTPMPGMIQGRDMKYTPSPLAYVAPVIEQIQGGQQSAAVQQAMADMIRAKAATADKYNAFQQEQARKELERQAARKAQSDMGVGESSVAYGPNSPVLGPPDAPVAKRKPSPFKPVKYGPGSPELGPYDPSAPLPPWWGF